MRSNPEGASTAGVVSTIASTRCSRAYDAWQDAHAPRCPVARASSSPAISP
jgi:hypothetical protein